MGFHVYQEACKNLQLLYNKPLNLFNLILNPRFVLALQRQ